MADKRCVIIGASPEKELSYYNGLIRQTDTVVCADGGYKKAALCGIRPYAVIGDFDSAPPPDKTDCEIISLPRKKDDTDTMFCIKEFEKRGFTDFLLLGMTGGRPDHTLANYSALLYLANRGLSGSIADADGSFHAVDRELVIDGQSGSGFLYETENYKLSADMPIGVSNTIASDRAFVGVSDGTAIAMIYKTQIGTV